MMQEDKCKSGNTRNYLQHYILIIYSWLQRINCGKCCFLLILYPIVQMCDARNDHQRFVARLIKIFLKPKLRSSFFWAGIERISNPLNIGPTYGFSYHRLLRRTLLLYSISELSTANTTNCKIRVKIAAGYCNKKPR